MYHSQGWWVYGHCHPVTGIHFKNWPPTESLIRRAYRIVNLIPTKEIWRTQSQPKLCDDLDLTEGVEKKKGLSRYVVCCLFKVAGNSAFSLLFFCKMSSDVGSYVTNLCQLSADFVSSDDWRVSICHLLISKYWTHRQDRVIITTCRFLVLVWL